ncbi:hypothetical protein [Polycladidibacter stylochi]|uniref:hypothetical protein n=1 Tax=Polycladidibacter stylochi TaxID=1807766 RepID=UPI00082B0EA6|nr:hypothetical protein [Pseudovibrio stylochi]
MSVEAVSNNKPQFEETMSPTLNELHRRTALKAQGIEQTKDVPEFTLGEFIDIINPLQHIPGINTLYRNITGDEASVRSRVLGSSIYGIAIAGPVGMAGLLAGNVAEMAATGQLDEAMAKANTNEVAMNTASNALIDGADVHNALASRPDVKELITGEQARTREENALDILEQKLKVNGANNFDHNKQAPVFNENMGSSSGPLNLTPAYDNNRGTNFPMAPQRGWDGSSLDETKDSYPSVNRLASDPRNAIPTNILEQMQNIHLQKSVSPDENDAT